MKKKAACSDEHVEDGVDSKRRNILKKAAYTAPKLVVLGLLTRSTNALGDSASLGPPGPPQPPGWSPNQP